MVNNHILSVEDLKVWFFVKKGISKIVNGVSFSITDGELLGIVGESGMGKTITANAILRYVREPGKIVGGRIIYRGIDLMDISEEQLNNKYRGKEIGLIASNASVHLNPLRRVGDYIADIYMTHHNGINKKDAINAAIDMLRAVGINDPERRAKSFPHELSGGMAQRVMIALVLINSPRLLIADECTTGLDVTVAAQVMDLFIDMFNRMSSSGIIITHDLGLVAQYCNSIAIMYCGQFVEMGPVNLFFESPCHPYSIKLLNALPERGSNKGKVQLIGTLPDTFNLPKGCLFYSRCGHSNDKCRTEEPPMQHIKKDYYVKCFYPLL